MKNLFKRSGATARSPSTRWMMGAILLFFTLGSIVSFWSSRELYQKERRNVQDEFLLTSLNMQKGIERELDLFFETLNSIGQLHNLSDRIKAEDFEEFSEKGLAFQKSILGAYGFAQHIPEELRKELEEPSATNQTPLNVVELTPDGQTIPAARRPDYFLLTYQYPPDALNLPNGFDFASQDKFMAAIQRMLMTGQQVLVSPFPEHNDDAVGMYVFSPIFYTDIESLTRLQPFYIAGFTVGILLPEQILNGVITETQRNIFYPKLIGPVSDSMTTLKPDVTLKNDRMTFTSPLAVADQIWMLECTAQADYFRRRMSNQPQTVLAGGLSVSLLISALMLIFVHQARRIEKLVKERTLDLKQANEKLGHEMKERMRLEYEMLNISVREQQRVSRDLHDSLGQKLTGAVYLSKALVEEAQQNSPNIAEAARHINELLKEGVAQLRRVARGLAPVDLSDQNLAQALTHLAEEISNSYNIQCRLESSATASAIPLKKSTHLYHIAQEAMNNAVKHGKASRIDLNLSTNQQSMTLSIHDNGTGFDQASSTFNGMGLRIMRYRAEMLGGELTIQAVPGKGTTITCTFPIDSSEIDS